jgi:hypothetical protein
MPTNLPDDFHGTGRPRGERAHWVDIDPTAAGSFEVDPPVDEDKPPLWFRLLAIAILCAASWALVGGVLWVIQHLARLIF